MTSEGEKGWIELDLSANFEVGLEEGRQESETENSGYISAGSHGSSSSSSSSGSGGRRISRGTRGSSSRPNLPNALVSDVETALKPGPAKAYADRLELFFFQKVLNASKTGTYDEDADRLFQEAAAAVFNTLDKSLSLDVQPPSHDVEVATPVYDISTKGLTYKIYERRRGKIVSHKVLLNNITTEARHGEVLAIMGPSGSSKSTILDALAGRIWRKSMSGSVLVNGEPMTSEFKRISAYVMQDDVHFPTLTARETLMYAARLKLPGSVSTEERIQRVDNILDVLGLKACANTRIGNEEIGGVSGGERRRISIALELIHEPMVLFLDEPTSGLDSTSALHIMQCLQKIAKERQSTVILTIHQPSFRILDTIDNTLVLSKGRPVYQGSIDDMIDFFYKLGFVKPDHVTAVEYMMEKIDEYHGDLDKFRLHDDQPNAVTWQTQRRRALSSYDYKVDPEDLLPLPSAAAEPKQATSKAEPEDGQEGEETQVQFANSMLQETWILAQRNLKNTCRTRALFVTRILIVLVTSFMMATLFFNSERDQEGYQQRRVFFAFTVAILVFTSCDAIPVFLMERQIFIRETSRGAYRASSYVVSNSLVIVPFMVVLGLLCTVTSYFAVGLVIKASAILYFTLVVVVVLSLANAFVAFISAVVPNFISAIIIFGATSAYQFLFSGFFVPRHSIPTYWLPLHYSSFFKYAYEGVLANELDSMPHHVWFDKLTSEMLLDKEDIKHNDHHQILNISYLLCFFVGYRILFYLSLRYNTTDIRR